MTGSLYLLICVYLFIFGSCVGSFLNVVAWRLPRKMSVISGRSACPSCGTQLKAYELIPFVSYICLAGKCRTCKARISPRYPLSELIAGIAAVLCFISFGFSLRTLYALGFAFLLTAVSFIDMETMEIPNSLIIAIAVFAAGSPWVTEEGIISRVIGFFAVSLPMLLLTFVIPDCFGGGDIKLIAVCGFILGWQKTLLAIFFALLLGGTVGIILLASKKAKKGQHIPFGQYLCAGCLTAFLFGEGLLGWYTSLF